MTLEPFYTDGLLRGWFDEFGDLRTDPATMTAWQTLRYDWIADGSPTGGHPYVSLMRISRELSSDPDRERRPAFSLVL